MVGSLGRCSVAVRLDCAGECQSHIILGISDAVEVGDGVVGHRGARVRACDEHGLERVGLDDGHAAGSKCEGDVLEAHVHGRHR